MSRLTIQIQSELHLETPRARPSYGDYKIDPHARCLALLGDIGYVCDARLFDFLEEQLQHFEIVFFLLGNHEAYGTSLPAARATMRSFAETMEIAHATNIISGKFVYLDQSRFDISNRISILGCTLFSSIHPEQVAQTSLFLSDFSSIENWTVSDHCTAHASDVAWLNSEVARIAQQEPLREIVILTHHSPTILEAATDPRHKKDSAQVRSGFSTDLSRQLCWISPQVKLWAFGHTHFNCDFQDRQTRKRVYANQKGYRRSDLLTFDPLKVVELSQGDQFPLVHANHEQEFKPRSKSDHKLEKCNIQ